MSSIDNSLEGGGSASASGKKGVIQLSDGNFNLTSNKDLKSDPATGTITTTGLTTTGTVFASTVSATSLIVDTLTESLTVVGDASITGNAVVDGSVSATIFDGDGGLLSNITVALTDTLQSVTTRGAVTTDTITVGALTTSGFVQGATISSTGQVIATGSLTGASATVSGQVQGATVSSTGQVIATGSLTGASLTVSDQVQGATVSSTGHVIATGSVTGTTMNTPTLVVSKDARITGNLTVSGGLVTITSTTTGTNQINITNNGTGPALIAKQTGAQPIVNFLDDSASALFISGGELTGKDGFVGLGTETPQERLDVQGNIVSSGTISSTNVETSNLTVTNFHSVTGTLTASNIATSNLTVSNRLSGGTISVSNVEATANLVVGGPANITGTLSAGGSLTGPSATVTGQIQGATVSSTGQVVATGSLTGASATVTGQVQGATVSSTGQVVATGSLTGASATVTGQVQGATVSSTGQVVATGSLTGASLTVTGDVQGASASLGAIDGSSLTVTGDVEGTSASLGAIDGTSVVVTGTAQGLNLTSTGTLSAAGITSSDHVTITGADKSLTASNISTSNLTVSNFHSITGTLSASNIATSNLTVSNRLSGGTISVSNIEATANLVVGGPVDITGTLSAGGSLTGPSLTVSGDVQGTSASLGAIDGSSLTVTGDVEGTSASLGVIDGTSVVVTGTVQGLNLTSTGTLSAAGITSSDNVTISGADKTLTASNVASSNLTVSNRLSGGTISVSNVEATANLVVGGPANITGSISGGAIDGSSLTVTGDIQGTSASLGAIDGSSLTVTGDVEGTSASLGAIDGSSLTVTGDVQGASASLGAIDGSSLTVTGDAQGLNLTATGTLSAAGITSSDNVTITGADKSLSASNVSTSNLTVSNRLSGGTISVSNLEATANLVVGGPADITGTLSAAGITSSAAVNVTGTISSSSTVTGTNLVVSGTAQGLNLTSTGTLSAAGITSSADTTVTGTLTASANVASGGNVVATNFFFGDGGLLSNVSGGGATPTLQQVTTQGATTTDTVSVGGLTSSAPVNVTGTISSSSTVTGTNLVVSGTAQGLNLTSTGTLSAAGIMSSEDITVTGNNKLSASNIETSNLTVTNLNSVTNDAFIGGTLSASNVETYNLTVTDTITTSNLVANSGDNILISSNLEVGTSNLFVDTTTGKVSMCKSDRGFEPMTGLMGSVQVFGNDVGYLSGYNINGDSAFVSSGTYYGLWDDINGNFGVVSYHGGSTNLFYDTINILTTTNYGVDINGTLSASNVETSNLTVSNRLSGGTISVSNLEATANLVVGGPADITGTLSAAGITSSADTTVTGTLTASANIVAGGNVVATNFFFGDGGLLSNVSGGGGTTPTLQQVTTQGATTTDSVTLNGGATTTTLTASAVTITGALTTNTGTGDATVNGSLTVQGDAVINSNLSAVTISTGTLSSTGNVSASFLFGDGGLLSNISTGIPTLQEVTTQGATTTDSITVGGLTTTASVSASFLFGDGGLMSNISTGTPTLQEVTTQGATTTDSITVGGLTTSNITSTFNTLTATTDVTMVQASGGGGTLTIGVQDAATYETHSGFVDADGNLWMTGKNDFGQCGDTLNSANSTTFRKVATGVSNVVCGNDLTMFIKTDGSLWGMGRNLGNRLGISGDFFTTPTQLVSSSPSKVIKVVTGEENSMLIKEDGSIWGCGRGAFIDNASFFANWSRLSISGSPASGIDVAVTKAGLRDRTFIIDTNNDLYGCGDGDYYGFGNGSTADLSVYTSLTGNVTQVGAAAGYASTALRNDGVLLNAGTFQYGSYGDGNSTVTVTTWTASNVFAGSSITTISTGERYRFAKASNGNLYGCGYNARSQLGISGFSITNWTQVATGLSKFEAGVESSYYIDSSTSKLYVAGLNQNLGYIGLGTGVFSTIWTVNPATYPAYTGHSLTAVDIDVTGTLSTGSLTTSAIMTGGNFLGDTITSNISLTANATITGTLSTNYISIDTATSSNLSISSNLEVGSSNLFVDTITGNVGVGTGSPQTTFQVVSNGTSQADKGAVAAIATDNTSFGGNYALLGINCKTAASSAYRFLQCNSGYGTSGTLDAEFILYGDGNATADGSWTGGGADYAEMFEWEDGNPDNEDRIGLCVKLNENKIKLMEENDDTSLILGVVSKTGGFIGDAAELKWSKKYLKDDFGRYLEEEYYIYNWTDEDGKFHSYAHDDVPSELIVPESKETIKSNRRILNPEYNPSDEYIPRSNRIEWETIGLFGKIRIRKGQPVKNTWIKLRNISEHVEEWFVR